MPPRYYQKPPIKSIGRILYSECYVNYYDRIHHNVESKYDRVCECRGYSADRPFTVYVHNDKLDNKPWKVVFHWTNENHKMKKVRKQGVDVLEPDLDTYHMMEILEAHASKSAAQEAMRRFAKESFEKVNNPAGAGEVCHNRIGGYDIENDRGKFEVRVGDLVRYTGKEGIIYRVIGEKRSGADWFLKIEPILHFLAYESITNEKHIRSYDCIHMVYPLDIIELGALYAKLGLIIRDEANRKSR